MMCSVSEELTTVVVLFVLTWRLLVNDTIVKELFLFLLTWFDLLKDDALNKPQEHIAIDSKLLMYVQFPEICAGQRQSS